MFDPASPPGGSSARLGTGSNLHEFVFVADGGRDGVRALIEEAACTNPRTPLGSSVLAVARVQKGGA